MNALATLATPPGALLLGALAAWTLQAAVLLLSHKIMVLAAATYLAHAGAAAAFVGLFCTAGLPGAEYAQAVHALRERSPRAHRLLGPGRAVMINLAGGLLALIIGTAPLMLGQLLGAGLGLSLAQTVVAGVTVFCLAAVLFLVLTELVLSRYTQVLPGPAFGTLVAASCIAVASHDYFHQLRGLCARRPRAAARRKAGAGRRRPAGRGHARAAVGARLPAPPAQRQRLLRPRERRATASGALHRPSAQQPRHGPARRRRSGAAGPRRRL